MASMNVLDIIYEQNDEIPFSILNNFISKSLENELNEIGEEENNFKEYDTKIDMTVNEIKELKTKAYTFNLAKCYECEGSIDFPSVAFKCGHGFHTTCLNSSISEDTECPKCKDEKYNALNEIKKYKEFCEKVNTSEKIENELEQKEDKTKFIYELYGKGLFNLGSVKDNNE